MSGEPVTLFSFDYPPLSGGVSRLCAELAAGLSRRGAAVTAIAQAGEDGPAGPAEVRVTRARPWREMAALRALRRRPRGAPVISGIWYPEGVLAGLARSRPHVVLAHGAELLPTRSRLRRNLWRRLLARTLRGADLVVANSAYTLGLVRAAAPGAEAVAVPLAVDHERFSPGDRAAAKTKYGAAGRRVISSVSRIRRHKGHDIVFRALASLGEDARRGVLYLIAGTGPDRPAIEAQAKELGVAGCVRWLGFVPEDGLPELYRASDLFVLCTREAAEEREVEGFGLVFLEAQACGTPVVGARAGGIPDAVKEGEGGWLVGPDDAEALADILRRLLDDPAAFEAAGRSGRERVERECTWDRYVDSFLAELSARSIEIG